jgi:hypothetical protein
MGEGSLGDGMAVTLLVLVAIVAMVGYHMVHHGIYHFIARNADMAWELSVFDPDLSALEFLYLLSDLPTNELARAFIISPEVQ